MAQTGVSYFLENYSYISNDSCLFHFDFGVGTYPVNNISKSSFASGFRLSRLGSSLITGPFIHNGYFVSSPPQSLQRCAQLQTNTGNGWIDGFRTGIDYERGFGFICVASGAKGVIFSNIESGNFNGSPLYKGFSFGINDANRLFFENRDDKGVASYFLTDPLGENNSLLVSYSNGSVTLGRYDYFSNTSISETHFLDKPLVGDTGVWLIASGRSDISNSFYNKQYGDGYLEAFLFFNEPVDDLNFKYISSGLVCQPYLTGNLSGYISGYEVTGYQTGLVLMSSGITGYNIVSTGLIEDDFGNIYTGYSKEPIYYMESGSGLLPMSGEVQYPVFSGETRIEIGLNTGYLSTFGMSKGVSIYSLGTGNVFSWNFEKNLGDNLSTNDVGKDYLINYDRVNEGFFIGDRDNFIFYLNGIMQNSGSFYITGDFYNPIVEQDRDYYISGGFIFSTGKYSVADYGSIDFVKYNSISIIDNFIHVAGTGDRLISTGINNLVFFNGQKLNTGNLSSLITSRNQVFVSSDSMYFSNCCDLFDGISGTLTIINNISGNLDEVNLTSGFLNTFSTKFKNDSLVCYLNGIKMEKNIDFFEGSSQDLFSSFGSFSGFKGVLYNNDANFFEN